MQTPRMTDLMDNWEHKSPAKQRQRLTEEGGDSSPEWLCLCHRIKSAEPRGKGRGTPRVKNTAEPTTPVQGRGLIRSVSEKLPGCLHREIFARQDAETS